MTESQELVCHGLERDIYGPPKSPLILFLHIFWFTVSQNIFSSLVDLAPRQFLSLFTTRIAKMFVVTLLPLLLASLASAGPIIARQDGAVASECSLTPMLPLWVPN